MTADPAGANIYSYLCIHGLDLRVHPRCYLCRPWGTASGEAIFTGGGNTQPWGHCHGCSSAVCYNADDRPCLRHQGGYTR